MNQKQVNQIVLASRWGILSSPTVWVCVAAIVVLALLTGCETKAQKAATKARAEALTLCDSVVTRLAGKALSRALPDDEQRWVRGNPSKVLYEEEYACNITPPRTVESVQEGNTVLCHRGAPNPGTWCEFPPPEKYSGFAPECYPLLLADDAGFDACWDAAQKQEAERRVKAKAEREAELERQAKARERRARGWGDVWCQTDAMDDVKRCWVESKWAEPDRPLDFPYEDMQMKLAFGCSSTGDSWIYVKFNDGPNFTGGDIKDGFHYRRFRIRWDGGKAQTWKMTHEWSEPFLHFQATQNAVSHVLAGNEALIRTPPFYAGGYRDFRIYLADATAKIDEAKSRCK